MEKIAKQEYPIFLHDVLMGSFKFGISLVFCSRDLKLRQEQTYRQKFASVQSVGPANQVLFHLTSVRLDCRCDMGPKAVTGFYSFPVSSNEIVDVDMSKR